LRAGVYEYQSAVGFDRALHDSESEAAPARFRSEEWIEEPIANLDRNAGSFVADSEGDRSRVEGNADRQRVERSRSYL
jgi:hypothetical protein